MRALLPRLGESVRIADERCRSRRRILRCLPQDSDPFQKIRGEHSAWFQRNPELACHCQTMFIRFASLVQSTFWYFEKRVILIRRMGLEKKGFFLPVFLEMFYRLAAI